MKERRKKKAAHAEFPKTKQRTYTHTQNIKEEKKWEKKKTRTHTIPTRIYQVVGLFWFRPGPHSVTNAMTIKFPRRISRRRGLILHFVVQYAGLNWFWRGLLGFRGGKDSPRAGVFVAYRRCTEIQFMYIVKRLQKVTSSLCADRERILSAHVDKSDVQTAVFRGGRNLSILFK